MKRCALMLLLAAPLPAHAQRAAVPLAKRGVDMVKIKDGPRLLGAIANRGQKVLSFAVERAWLKKHFPQFLEQQQQRELREIGQAEAQQLERLREWRERRRADVGLKVFLDESIQRLEKRRAEQAARVAQQQPLTTQMLMLSILVEQVERSYVQPRERKQVVLVSWRERLANASERSVNSLVRELKEKEIEFAGQPIDLSSRLPTRPLDSRQWARRVALVEYLSRGNTGGFHKRIHRL